MFSVGLFASVMQATVMQHAAQQRMLQNFQMGQQLLSAGPQLAQMGDLGMQVAFGADKAFALNNVTAQVQHAAANAWRKSAEEMLANDMKRNAESNRLWYNA